MATSSASDTNTNVPPRLRKLSASDAR